MSSRVVPFSSLLAALGMAALPATAIAQTAILHVPAFTARSTSEIIGNPKPALTNMPMVSTRQLPMAALQSHNTLPSGAYALVPGLSPGSSDGVHRKVNASTGVEPEAYGNLSPVSIAPYTTARASADVLGPTATASAVAVTSFPWRATGKLYFKIGTDTYVCSASLIGPGLLVTAAHCVFDFGMNSAAGYHTNYAFVPAQNAADGTTPYGAWTALGAIIAPSYYSGTDSCSTKGVACSNDIAVMVMAPDANGRLPGNLLGWYSYAWDGYSFVQSFGNASLASITQLGYPIAFDGGMMMERTDGVGSYWSPDGVVQQTILGSAMSGGASGGPWLVNFGAVPSVSSAASLGNTAGPNVVVGVTSWSFTTAGNNTMGASWFGQNTQFPAASYLDSHGVNRGAGNIGALVAAACTFSYSSC